MPLATTAQDALEALKLKDYARARALMAAEDPAHFEIQHYLIKGLAEMSENDWHAVLKTFTAASNHYPDFPAFWLNRGMAEENVGRFDDAIASQEKCVRMNPAQGEAWGNLSNLYRRQGLFSEAESAARKAMDNGADRTEALNSLGLALTRQGKFKEAEDALIDAQRLSPLNTNVIFNRANLMVDQMRFDEAWPLFETARSIGDRPTYRRDEGMARLLAGDYAKGFGLYEARLDMPRAQRLRPPCPLWRGEGLSEKTLLIIAEQGFGDVIQFCRYQELLPNCNLVWAVPKPLVRLLSGNVRGKVMAENGPLPVCDYYTPILSLPLCTRPYPLPALEPYLCAPSGPTLPEGVPGRKIGLVWAGSPTHERDHDRSLPLEMMTQFIRTTEGQFYAPFTGDAVDDIGDLPIIRLDKLIGDFADTAALLSQLDFLITVDTAVAHVAGALGIRTFLMLPFCPDWRWGTGGEQTAWYPSVTLVRQKSFGDWGSVLARLRQLI